MTRISCATKRFSPYLAALDSQFQDWSRKEQPKYRSNLRYCISDLDNISFDMKISEVCALVIAFNICIAVANRTFVVDSAPRRCRSVHKSSRRSKLARLRCDTTQMLSERVGNYLSVSWATPLIFSTFLSTSKTCTTSSIGQEDHNSTKGQSIAILAQEASRSK